MIVIVTTALTSFVRLRACGHASGAAAALSTAFPPT